MNEKLPQWLEIPEALQYNKWVEKLLELAKAQHEALEEYGKAPYYRLLTEKRDRAQRLWEGGGE